MPEIRGHAPAGINNAGPGPQGQEAQVGAGIQPGGLADMANAPPMWDTNGEAESLSQQGGKGTMMDRTMLSICI
jgi:hypothetical protein